MCSSDLAALAAFTTVPICLIEVAAIAKAIAESAATSIKQMGTVVKAAKAALEGKTVDGKVLSDRVRDRLSKMS